MIKWLAELDLLFLHAQVEYCPWYGKIPLLAFIFIALPFVAFAVRYQAWRDGTNERP